VAACVITVTVIFILIELFWKMAFIGGRAPGIYWLFIFADAVLPPAIVIAFILTLIFFLIGLGQYFIRSPKPKPFFVLAVTFLVAAIGLATTVPVLFAQNSVHMDSIRVRGHTYYLTAYPLFDINYRLYECDAIGFLCTNVYFSGDLMGPDAWPGTLEYSVESNVLSVRADELGTIYSYSPP
jgi:hypothetical protein